MYSNYILIIFVIYVLIMLSHITLERCTLNAIGRIQVQIW
jgi:hypothetical protein